MSWKTSRLFEQLRMNGWHSVIHYKRFNWLKTHYKCWWIKKECGDQDRWCTEVLSQFLGSAEFQFVVEQCFLLFLIKFFCNFLIITCPQLPRTRESKNFLLYGRKCFLCVLSQIKAGFQIISLGLEVRYQWFMRWVALSEKNGQKNQQLMDPGRCKAAFQQKS